MELVIQSILLGAGLAMDAFSISIADGLGEQNMKRTKMLAIAGTFAAFQFVMPVLGWVIVRTAVERFNAIESFIPWIALILLAYIGGKMVKEGAEERKKTRESETSDATSETEARTGTTKLYSETEARTGTTKLYSETDAKMPGAAGKVRVSLSDLLVQGIATSIDALSVGFTIERYVLSQALLSSFIIGIVTLVICILGLLLGRQIGSRVTGKASILGGIILIIIGLEIWVRGVILFN